jgi:hypothetical protein
MLYGQAWKKVETHPKTIGMRLYVNIITIVTKP